MATRNTTKSLSGTSGDEARLAEHAPAETPHLQSYRELALKHLDNGICSLFRELTGLRLQVVWTPSWHHRWIDGDFPALCSWCRHTAATLIPGGGCGHNDGDSHPLAGALKPQQEPNFSTCRLGIRHQWHPMIVQASTLGFLFIESMDDSVNMHEDRSSEPLGGHKAEAAKSACCSPDKVITRLGAVQRERAGMLLKLVAANVEAATLASLKEAAVSNPTLDALEHRLQENSRQQTQRDPGPDLPATGAERQASPHHQQIIQRMLDYLQSNYHRPIQLGDVADALKMNACYVSSLFSATTGGTYQRYLEELRVAKAKELLANPGMHICEVACATGFTTAGTFCRTFKARTGLSPRAWRNSEDGR
ncbi:MAG: AraC family transcriptional regulator [Luteolibacter sp.]